MAGIHDTAHYNLFKFLSVTADYVYTKNRSQQGQNSRLDGQFEVSSGASLTCQLLHAGTDSDLFAKGCLKSFLNAKVKSLMIKCINQGFRSDGHCQCSRPRYTLLCCDPCVSLEPRTVTHFKLMVPPLQKLSIHIMNTVRKRIEW